MLVASVTVFPLRGRLICPFRTTFGQHDSLDNLLVRLTLDNGIDGWGEAAVAPHITGETVPLTTKNLKEAAEGIVGRRFRTYSGIVSRFRKKLPDNKAAAAALETALLDAVSRARGVPLWRLFGDRPVRLRTDITIVIASLRETAAAAKRFYRRGFRQFKIKIGRDGDADLQRVLAVRKAAPRCRILLDANQGYTPDQTIKFLRVLAARGIRPAMIEQPVARDDWEGLKKIKETRLAPVCADESVRSLADGRRIIWRRAADIINIKLMKTGFGESREIVRLARKRGLRLMIGGMMESSLAMTAAAHLAAGLRCFDFVDLDTPFFVRGGTSNPYLDGAGVYAPGKVRAGIGITPRVAGRPRFIVGVKPR